MESNAPVARTLRLSVLDRLQEDDPVDTSDPRTSWEESLRALKASVERDLDWLLNTRRIATPASDDYPEVNDSVYHYGMPDITSLSWDAEVVHRRLTRRIEECIQRFEPRLLNVKVSAVEEKDRAHRHLRFAVDAMLRVEPNPQRVTFDTVLEIASSTFRVSGGADA